MEQINKLHFDKPVRLIELFAGIGSQAKALQNINVPFEHYRVIEWDKYPMKSYNAIFGTDFQTQDITQISGADLGIVDTDKYCYVVTYSFPCTDLSLAGQQAGMRKGGGTRSGLLWEVERLLNETDELPQILVMENVRQVHNKKNLKDFEAWIDFLSSKGYTSKWQDLNAKDFGVPQSRNRCYMISWLGDYTYDFPIGIPLEKSLADVLEEQVDSRYKLKAGSTISNEDIEGEIIRQFAHMPPELEPKLVGGVGPKDSNSGTQWKQQNRIYGASAISIAVTTGFRPYYCVTKTDSIRKLSPKECWRLMGQKDEDFEKASMVNSNTQLFKQAGNAIVVDVLMRIFNQMKI